jgi:glycosyltransferase involved in cell wall biosynthesis
MRRVLIVSPHFPPTNAPDHQRVRMSLPYFRENGWEPVVLAVDAGRVGGPQDSLLATTVPSDVPVHRVGALPISVTRLAGLGNLAYRAWFQLKGAGDRLLRDGQFDLVYFSTTQFVATALGRHWQLRYGVPYVVDIQDPWRTDYYERPGAPPPPGGWKYRFARWQAARLEERAWRGAAGFVSVSEDYLAQLRARYAWFDSKPSAYIPFGAPEADFELARAHREWAPAFVREPGAVHLVSVGAVGPIMRTALEYLFAGLRNLRAAAPADAARLRLHFIGTSYAGSRAEPSVLPVAQDCGVAELVREATGRVGYFTAISTLLAADAVIIPGSDDTAYNPSKVAASFLAGKPTLALTPAGSAMDRMVSELGFATVARWPAPEGVNGVTEFLRHLLHPGTAPAAAVPNRELFSATHTARVRTRQQCELFARALGPAL